MGEKFYLWARKVVPETWVGEPKHLHRFKQDFPEEIRKIQTKHSKLEQEYHAKLAENTESKKSFVKNTLNEHEKCHQWFADYIFDERTTKPEAWIKKRTKRAPRTSPRAVFGVLERSTESSI